MSSMGPTAEIGQSAPMMKVIGQLWCHEVTRTFADRLISDDGKFQYELATAEIDVYLDYLKGRSFLDRNYAKKCALHVSIIYV